jgi:hypothetical protein
MDLLGLAGRCAGVRKLDDERFRFDCPLDPTHTVIARQVGDRLVLVCLENCERVAILDALSLNDADLTISTRPALNGPIMGPSAPLEAVSAPPAMPAANGAHGSPKTRDYGSWQLEVGYCIKGSFDRVPREQREMLAGYDDATLIETVIETPLSLVRDHQAPLWPLPENLSDTEVEEEIRRLAENAVKAFKDVYLPATTNGQMPAVLGVGEIDRTPVDAFEAFQALRADQRLYSWAGLVREAGTLVLTALMGAGKTTLAMNVARGWALGVEVLGRLCRPSKTLVVVSPKEYEAWVECIGFWGVRGHIYLIASHKTHFDTGPEQAVWFEDTMKKFDCETFIFDTLFDFFGMPPNTRGDSNRIAMAEQTPLLEVVRAHGWSGIVTGHAPKTEAQAVVARDPEEAFGGHSAWTAQHRMRAVIRRKAKGANAFITGRGGYGDNGVLEERMLLFDEQTRLVTLGGKFSDYLGETALPGLIEALEGSGWASRSDLIKATGKSKSWVYAGVKFGLKTNAIKWNGRAGRGAKYALPEEPDDAEQGNLLN